MGANYLKVDSVAVMIVLFYGLRFLLCKLGYHSKKKLRLLLKAGGLYWGRGSGVVGFQYDFAAAVQ